MASSFDASFTVDNYLCEVSFVKEDGDYIYGRSWGDGLTVDLFVDGIPYMDLVCLFDLSEEDRLCIERGEAPKRAHKKRAPKRQESSDEDSDEVDYDAPIEKRMLNRKHRN